MKTISVRWLVLSLMTAAICSLPGEKAEARDDGAPVIRWEDVVTAVDHHPLIGVGTSRLERSKGELGTAREFANPEVEASAGRGKAFGSGESATTYSLKLVIPLQWYGQRRSKIEAARAGTEVAGAEAEVLRLTAVNELKSLFILIARDQALGDRLRRYRDQYALLVDLTRKRVEKGEARPSDWGRVQAEFERFEIELARTETRAEAARRSLDQWLGGSLPADYRVAFELEDLPPIPSLEEGLQAVEEKNPLVPAGLARIKRADATIKLERYAGMPVFGIGGGYDRELDAENASAGVVFTLPVFNQNRGAVAAARAESQTARFDLEREIGLLKQQAIETHGEAASAGNAAAAYRTSILPRTEENIAAVEKQYRYGEISLLEVLYARRVQHETWSEYISLLSEYHLACARLAMLRGEK